MGGNLAWTLRREDGTEYRMDRWTNSMPHLINTPGFLAGEPGAIEAALEEWLKLKEDWEQNRDAKTFAHRETPFFAPYPYGLKPSEYGFVLTDFASQTILSLQGYSNLSQINATRLIYGARANETSRKTVERLDQAAAARRVASYELLLKTPAAAERFAPLGGTVTLHPYGGAWMASIPGTVALDELTSLCDLLRDDVPEHPEVEMLKKLRGDLAALPQDSDERAQGEKVLELLMNGHKNEHTPFISGHAMLNHAPFTFESFPETSQGYADLLQRVLELGFSLSGEERNAWDTRIRRTRRLEQEERA